MLETAQELLRHSALWRVVAWVLLIGIMLAGMVAVGVAVGIWKAEGWGGIARLLGGLMLGLFQWGCLILVIALTFFAVRAVVRFFG